MIHQVILSAIWATHLSTGGWLHAWMLIWLGIPRAYSAKVWATSCCGKPCSNSDTRTKNMHCVRQWKVHHLSSVDFWIHSAFSEPGEKLRSEFASVIQMVQYRFQRMLSDLLMDSASTWGDTILKCTCFRNLKWASIASLHAANN